MHPRFTIHASRFTRLSVALALLVAACSRTAPPVTRPLPAEPTDIRALTGPAEYDVVIRNGRVLDGMGNPWIIADVGIRDGKFAKIGHALARGEREIEARGLYVSPGWIDMMDQSGGVLPRNGLAENKLRQGVTTAIGGEGGFPVSASGIPGYFATLERQGISINFGSYYSQTQARVAVLGQSARAPTPAELERMRASVDTAMRAGAMGMTTALIYPPSSYTTTDELVEVARAAAKYGGIYASHIRGEGAEVVQSVREVITIAERAGMPGEVFHLKVAYQPGWGVLMDSVRALVEAARARGVDVAADLYAYTAGGTGLEATIPSWAFEGGDDSLKARLRDPQVRERLKREIQTGSPGWWNIVEAAGGWTGIVLANARNPANAQYNGMRLPDIAKAMGKGEADAAWDLVLEGQGRVMAIYHMMSEPDVETALRFPWTSIGSDAGAALSASQGDDLGLPHPRAYGNHVRVISRYVKERKVLTLEEAVRRMTSDPADFFGIKDRGRIAPGMAADLAIFDPATVGSGGRPERLYDLPGGAKRMVMRSRGIEYTLVNGEVTWEKGALTGAARGEVLRS